MVIVKLHKLYLFYSIFMAPYYVFISMSIFTFKVSWEISYCEGFYFVETIQMIWCASQLSGFYMVWVSTVKNIQVDYYLCCFNINKLSCFVIFRKGSCTTDLLVLYVDAAQYQSVEEAKLVVSLIALPEICFLLM